MSGAGGGGGFGGGTGFGLGAGAGAGARRGGAAKVGSSTRRIGWALGGPPNGPPLNGSGDGQPAGVHPAPERLGVAVSQSTEAAPKISPSPTSFFMTHS